MEKVRAVCENWLRDSGLAPWDPRTRRGLARHLTIRQGYATGEVVAGLTTTAPALREASGLADRLAAAVPGLVGVVHTTHPAPYDHETPVGSTTVWGRPYIYEEFGGLRLKISLQAFFQTNTVMTGVLYETAADAAGLGEQRSLNRPPVIWDLYSGIGSIGLYLARGGAGAVLGIEIVGQAVRDARENASINELETSVFLEGDARVVLKEILERRRTLPEALRRPDVVVVDPPRAGLAPKVVARVAAAEPERIVYVSCNPSTLAPNAAQLRELGYQLVRVTPVDMFPHTPHIEAVALFRRSGSITPTDSSPSPE